MDKFIGMFGNICSIDLVLDGDSTRKTALLFKDHRGERLPIYSDNEDVSCSAVITVRPGKKLEHTGVKVELVGQIELSGDRISTYDFFTIAKDLETAGIMTDSKKYSWKFNSVDKQYETYTGIAVRLRYFVRLIIQRNFLSNITKECDFIVQNLSLAPAVNNTIKMEVGIEDFLHIEFEYNKSKYHLSDVIIGKVYFLLVRIKIKTMELEIIRTETAGTGSSAISESETLTKFEIMDGSPIRMESIPVRLYIGGLDVSPTYKNIQNKFSVKYFLNLVLVDEDDRRYFKKQEITFWREKVE
ncbi:putative vacuolar protein sorting-associated protein 26 [Cardiosporidium cionae]|uniref:Vacuolar protein sorting-associated protein 26 n=1 Tax=Cardiosporidium cionae TaxID=476202 RepID=A0ABQ7JGA9_9APIC|nr:putative vacuolar protein sorting-associated protein 26 [Cardiosporidium cionae]|eukprot:KAF8823057.1 putative vacuolar protein sorting-associated protein 26 [Cardiosporidium cionae]